VLLLKLLLVPGLVAAVTLAVRRWGPAVGGWLAGLPVVAGPVLVFYAIEQGDAFAAQAAHATLAGLIATSAFAATILVLYALQPPLVPRTGFITSGLGLLRGVGMSSAKPAQLVWTLNCIRRSGLASRLRCLRFFFGHTHTSQHGIAGMRRGTSGANRSQAQAAMRAVGARLWPCVCRAEPVCGGGPAPALAAALAVQLAAHGFLLWRTPRSAIIFGF